MPPKNDMPDNTWPITRDDKVEIQAFGRALNEFIMNHFKDRDQLHIKLIVGGFNYVMDLQSQKAKLIADDLMLADKAVKAAKIEEKIEEPYSVEPEAPELTKQDRIEMLRKQLAALESEVDLEEATPAPTEGALPMAQPSEGPSNQPVADATPAPLSAPEGAEESGVGRAEEPTAPAV